MDPDAPERTLCGYEGIDAVIWRNDERADCERCQDVWIKRTDWSFPLPELVTTVTVGQGTEPGTLTP